MANHGFVHLKTRINADRLEAELQKINQARFKGKIKIARGGEWGKGQTLFEIEFSEDFHILFWLANPRKIEHRHGPGGDLRWWIEDVFANDLAVNLKGMLADEGVGGKWKPKAGKWPTLRSMLDEKWQETARYDPESDLYKKSSETDRKKMRLVDAYFTDMNIKESKEIRPDLAEFIGERHDPPVEGKLISSKDGSMSFSIEVSDEVLASFGLKPGE